MTDVRENPKGYSISTTLEEDVTTYEQAADILLKLTDNVTSRMRRDKTFAQCIGVDIRFSKLANANANTPSTRFTNKSHQKKLVNATDVTDEIYQVVMELFGELWRGEPLRLLGVALSDVTKEPQEQISLFRDDKKEKARKLDAAMDQIRGRYGWDAVKRGK